MGNQSSLREFILFSKNLYLAFHSPRSAFKVIDTKTLFCLCKPQTGHQTLNYIFFFTMIYKVYLLAFTLPGGINPNMNPWKWQILFSLVCVAHVLDLRGIEVTWFAQICLMLEAKPGDGH